MPHSLPSCHAGVIPIHEGYQSVLDSQLQALAEEAAQCITLLFPRANNQNGAPAAATTATTPAPAGSGGKSVRFGPAETAAAAAAPLDVGSAEVQGTLGLLLAGLEGELLGLIDGVRPVHAALCLPMLGATLRWRARLAPRGPACRPLLALLGRCEERLRAALAAFFGERSVAIQRCAGFGRWDAWKLSAGTAGAVAAAASSPVHLIFLKCLCPPPPPPI